MHGQVLGLSKLLRVHVLPAAWLLHDASVVCTCFKLWRDNLQAVPEANGAFVRYRLPPRILLCGQPYNIHHHHKTLL